MAKEYIALFEYDDEAGYGVVFPDLPGCFSAGDDYDDAMRNAYEALPCMPMVTIICLSLIL